MTAPLVRTPTILQMDALECGAAALGMVLAWHGRWVPLPELREACGVSRDGSRALNIAKAARAHGLTAKGFRCEPAHLRDFPVPAILFVNLNHFVVLEGFAGDRVRLNDPAAGRRLLGSAEFDAMFSGVVLCLEPGPEFRRQGRPPRTLADLGGVLAGLRAPFALALVAGLALILPGLVVPTATQIFVDHYLIDRQAHWIPALLGVLAAGAALQAGLAALKDLVLARLRGRIAVAAAAGMFRRALRLPTRFFTQRHAATLAGRVDLARTLGAHAGTELVEAVLAAVSCLFFLMVMLAYSPLLTMVSVSFTVALSGLFALGQRRMEELGRKAAQSGIKLYGRTMQGIAMVETLKANGTDGGYFGQWAGHLANLLRDRQAIGGLQAVMGALPDSVMLLNRAAVLALSAWLVARGEMSVGMLAAFQALIGAFTIPLNTLILRAMDLKQARGTLDQIQDVANSPLSPEFAPGPASGTATPASATGRVRKLSGSLRLDGVTFGYSPLDGPLIEDFRLDLVPGSRVALVGASGSGKSTVGRLASGLYEPWAGDILLDGLPLRSIPRDVLRNSLSVVDQEIVLFDGTVRDNITLWDAAMPEQRVIRAARDAMIHDDIVARPGGYGSRIEEGGRNWSGGQRQRLEIARALVGEPSLLVLDEATSALDPLVEKALIDNIRRRGCTCLIIAHRLSTIRDCDEIVVLDRGRVLERGPHEALMAAGGPYRRLVES
jgi:NHLM bacteriocin system ABC transporter peptidase/ATP-binding protein